MSRPLRPPSLTSVPCPLSSSDPFRPPPSLRPPSSANVVLFLRLLFTVVLASMLGITTWASLQCPLFAIPRDVFTHPWFLATLLDAYWAFIAFFIFVAWKEQSLLARILWFIALILLGNIAIASYMLRELFAIPATGPLNPVFTRRNPGTLLLPALLTAASLTVYAIA